MRMFSFRLPSNCCYLKKNLSIQVWNQALKRAAQAHANKCNFQHSTDLRQRNVGENLYWTSGKSENQFSRLALFNAIVEQKYKRIHIRHFVLMKDLCVASCKDRSTFFSFSSGNKMQWVTRSRTFRSAPLFVLLFYIKKRKADFYVYFERRLRLVFPV